MLHAHVEALLHHCVIKVDVGAWANSLVRAVLVDVSCLTLVFESHILRVKDSHVALQGLCTWLLERARSRLSRSSSFVLWHCALMDFHLQSVLVLPWAWHVKLQALTVEYLIVVETGRGLVKTDILSREYFIIGGATLRCPLSSCILEIILNFIGCFGQLLSTSQSIAGGWLGYGAHLTLHGGALFNS